MQAGELIPDEVLGEFVADTLARSPGGWLLAAVRLPAHYSPR
jgi:hypothetical protein